MHPLIIDSFAGGGGASEGIRAAIGRDPDYALNHDRLALAMHRINHPDTHHIEEDVWNVDARSLCAGRSVGLLWMSPDCKHFSKAKGGKPREKEIRGLAWVGVRWIKSLPKAQRPRVVFLENVEEFQEWGPLLDDGKPCPLQRGATFRSFVAAFHAMGYAVEWRELRACDYGAPTIRKRLFLVARRDGKPIVWPEPTHGAPTSEGVLSGRLKPWRTAAEIIDWSLPCPSIFETSTEIKAKHGTASKRPLAEATMARIAKGTWRYVITAAKPFLVRVNHGDSGGRRDRGLDEPMPTATHYGGDALVAPFVSYGQQGGASRDPSDPLHTITASPKDQNAVVAPFITEFNTGSVGRGIDEPVNTVTSHSSDTHGGGAAPLGLVSGILVPRYGERAGQEPRARAVDQPAPVIVPTGNEGSLAAIHMTRQFGASVGSAAEEPVGTITAGGAGKAGVVAAFLAQHNTERGAGIKAGSDVREPISTITSGGGHQTVVASHMLNLRGSDRRGGPIDAPAPTATSGGNHAAAVYAFLQTYYGSELDGQTAGEPLHTVTTKPRHGVVTVTIEGQRYAIVDIGMRMLTPRERFSAQGFRTDYVIDRGELEDGTIQPLTLEQQGRMCGNSVCPQMSEALVLPNYREDQVHVPERRRELEPMPMFAAE
ncbi:DNA cytosine methyltransferase [Methylobacterium brachythecii]|uniref:DNA (cytosine-5-)-methyltransferase n=1 Tax=Methylobacterium brachythecii TaxID=1176177 RepID=A0A7W6F6J2_9HYPH|nr:DNA cytosine methyltransferase [Methylobacterium brachythecii]MBB3902076.1 DNA (cytosine-5)-methyltransferase 1 [Methylobacterium brachythecii]GLS44473.1 type II DNA modification methyltransferase [Methylobacterium brachythecii]